MKRKAVYNMLTSFILEVVSLICAFVLPRLIMQDYGSEYNGIVSSVTQFLSVVTLLRGGVGGVTRAALYKPLAENDHEKTSVILRSTERFMRKISLVFVAFLLLFAGGYPLLVRNQFDWFFSFSLVLILGISTVAQYYFGITYQFLLQADQKSYIYSLLQTAATILNTVLSVLLIRGGVEFRLMKLVSALVFAAIPLALYWYVHRHYRITRQVAHDDSVLKQRWDAFAHQVAAFIHSNTDVMLLTLFTDLYQVSVYTVYYMVANGIKKFVTIFSSGIEAILGRFIATKDQRKLAYSMDMYEWLIHTVSTTVFACAAVLIVPFMRVYTQNITDADYIQPLFGCLMCLGFYLSCVRLPYQNVVEAAGHFKNTRNGAIAEAAINILVSLLLVGRYGCIGVAIGTAVAMGFRTAQYAVYAFKNILNRSCLHLLKRAAISVLNLAVIAILYFALQVESRMQNYVSNYYTWAMAGAAVFAAIACITVGINALCYPGVVKGFKKLLKKRP